MTEAWLLSTRVAARLRSNDVRALVCTTCVRGSRTKLIAALLHRSTITLLLIQYPKQKESVCICEAHVPVSDRTLCDVYVVVTKPGMQGEADSRSDA
jgi:hypothetical protein